MRTLFALALLVAVAPAAPVPKELKKKDDKAALLGTWKPTNANSAWFEFADDGTLQTWHGQKGNGATKWTYALDPDATPRRVKLTYQPGGQPWYDCLYEVDGDTLKFVFLLKNGMVPPAKVEAGPDLQLHELAREPAK